MDPKCPKCFDAVVADAKLLRDGDWRLGEDARFHWRQLYASKGVCGVAVLADSGKRRLYEI